MASHEPADAEWRHPLGVGDVAVERAQYAVEELRSAPGPCLQCRNEAQRYRARRVWTFPRHHPSALARMPATLLRRNDRQISGTPVRERTERTNGTLCLCQ